MPRKTPLTPKRGFLLAEICFRLIKQGKKVNELHRDILKGEQYENLIPKVSCQMQYVGKGDTDFSVSKMKECVEQFHQQMGKIAGLMQGDSLERLCANVHFFCYWHFDYSADKKDQMLRSPACSWHHRYTGIDCKSYSIAVSSILTCLRVNHFLRKTAYENAGEFTHVYVVVPANQKITDWRELQEYYMIDGTVNTSIEDPFLEARDEFIGMKHFILNGPNQSQLNGINIQQISFSSIKNLFSSLSCIGGSAYSEALLNQNVNKFTSYINGLVTQINDTITNGNYTTLADKVQEMDGMCAVIHSAAWDKKWWFDGNSCTNKRFDAFIAVAKYFDSQVVTALYAYINQYFNMTTISGSKTYTNVGLESQGWVFLESPGDFVQSISIPNFQLTVKNLVVVIKAFEFTPPLVSVAENGGDLNIPQFLESLSTVISVFTPPSTDDPNNSDGSEYTYEDLPETETSKAGMGIVGWLLVAGALGFAFVKMPDEKQSKTKKSTKNGK